MGKFDDAFEGVGGSNGGGQSQDSSAIKELHAKQDKEIVELFDTQAKAKSRVGVVSGIIMLGLQDVDDAKMLWNGTLAQEAEEIAKKPKTYFENGVDDKGNKVRYKRWPQPAQQSIAITVDFPQYQYDYGGDIGTTPLRFLLNGSFTPKGRKPWESIVGRKYDLKETTKDFDPQWSLGKISLPYKLALATGAIKTGEPFTKNQLGKLIGKAALFEVRLHIDDKGYKQEHIKFMGEVPEGMVIPELDEKFQYFVRLDRDNDPVAVKQLRTAVKNTIKLSSSYEGSKLQEQYNDVLFPAYNKDKAEEKVESKEVDEEVSSNLEEDFDSLPF